MSLCTRRGLAPIYGVDVADPPERPLLFLKIHGNPQAAMGADSRAYFQHAVTPRNIPATSFVGLRPTNEWSTFVELTSEIIESEFALRFASATKPR